MRRILAVAVLGVIGCLSVVTLVSPAYAQNQVEAPDRQFIFFDDLREEQAKKSSNRSKKDSQKRKKKSKNDGTVPFDLTAPSIKFDSTGNAVDADGGVVISYSNSIIEADKGTFNTQTRDAELQGDVRVSDLTGDLLSDYAQINFDTGAGELQRSEIYFEEGGYIVQARETIKEPGEVFSFEDVSITTCDCPDGGDCSPWRLQGSRARITRDGYGHVQNAVLRAYDVPVMYFPYMIFPAKTERQTGFLRPEVGLSNRNGFKYEQPFFWALDESTDATIMPIIQTKARYGVQNEFRKIFSATHNLDAGLVYFDESPRDGELKGTVIDGLDDPTIDENRLAGYLDYSLDTDIEGHPIQALVNGNYVSDDLFLREYEIDKIAPFNTRFVTSTAALRTPFIFGQQVELSSEYNQAMVDDDDLIFQRLPELNVLGYQTYRPFGQNPYGVKVVHYNKLSAVNFDRPEDYRGSRSEAYESLKVPFFYQNYFEGLVEAEGRASYYSVTQNPMDDDSTPGAEPRDGPTSSSDRLLPGYRAQLGTTFEKVVHLGQDSMIKQIADLGRSGRVEELSRVKHVIQPLLRYRYVPEVDQSSNPQFDSNDFLAKRNNVVYGINQTLLGRYEPRNQYLFGMEETTPEAEDFESLGDSSALDEKFNFGVPTPSHGGYKSLRRGSLKELSTLSVMQAYDFASEYGDSPEDSDTDALSDVAVELGLFPNDHFRFRTRTDYNTQDQEFSSYGIDGQLVSRRGDELRSRLTFVDTTLRQLESGLQVTLNRNMKLGYYSRYDDFKGDFIESRVGLRLSSDCKCWVVDLEWAEQTNPNETKALINITLVGLGELGNEFFNQDKDQPQG